MSPTLQSESALLTEAVAAMGATLASHADEVDQSVTAITAQAASGQPVTSDQLEPLQAATAALKRMAGDLTTATGRLHEARGARLQQHSAANVGTVSAPQAAITSGDSIGSVVASPSSIGAALDPSGTPIAQVESADPTAWNALVQRKAPTFNRADQTPNMTGGRNAPTLPNFNPAHPATA